MELQLWMVWWQLSLLLGPFLTFKSLCFSLNLQDCLPGGYSIVLYSLKHIMWEIRPKVGPKVLVRTARDKNVASKPIELRHLIVLEEFKGKGIHVMMSFRFGQNLATIRLSFDKSIFQVEFTRRNVSKCEN